MVSGAKRELTAKQLEQIHDEHVAPMFRLGMALLRDEASVLENNQINLSIQPDATDFAHQAPSGRDNKLVPFRKGFPPDYHEETAPGFGFPDEF